MRRDSIPYKQKRKLFTKKEHLNIHQPPPIPPTHSFLKGFYYKIHLWKYFKRGGRTRKSDGHFVEVRVR